MRVHVEKPGLRCIDEAHFIDSFTHSIRLIILSFIHSYGLWVVHPLLSGFNLMCLELPDEGVSLKVEAIWAAGPSSGRTFAMSPAADDVKR